MDSRISRVRNQRSRKKLKTNKKEMIRPVVNMGKVFSWRKAKQIWANPDLRAKSSILGIKWGVGKFKITHFCMFEVNPKYNVSKSKNTMVTTNAEINIGFRI